MFLQRFFPGSEFSWFLISEKQAFILCCIMIQKKTNIFPKTKSRKHPIAGKSLGLGFFNYHVKILLSVNIIWSCFAWLHILLLTHEIDVLAMQCNSFLRIYNRQIKTFCLLLSSSYWKAWSLKSKQVFLKSKKSFSAC